MLNSGSFGIGWRIPSIKIATYYGVSPENSSTVNNATLSALLVESIANGDIVYIPPGNYSIGTVTCPTGTNLTGCRPTFTGTAFQNGTQLTGTLNISGTTAGVNISNMSITAAASAGNGINIQDDFSDIYVDNVLVIGGSAGHGILIEQKGGSGQRVWISNSLAYTSAHGYAVKAKNIFFDSCTAIGCTVDGFAIVSDNLSGGAGVYSLSDNVSLNNCYCDGCAVGIILYSRDTTSEDNSDNVTPANNIRFVNTTCVNSTSVGLAIGDFGTGSGATYLTPTRVSIIGGNYGNNGTYGIALRKVSTYREKNATFGGNSSGDYSIIRADITDVLADGLTTGVGQFAWPQPLDPTDATPVVNKILNVPYITTLRLAFTSGGTSAISIGSTVTGDTSGATATVLYVNLTSGSWAAGDAAGDLWISNQSGTFQAEELNTGNATIAGDSTSTDITNFDSGFAGQYIDIIIGGSTVKNNGNIVQGSDMTTVGSAARYFKDTLRGSHWYRVNRTDS